MRAAIAHRRERLLVLVVAATLGCWTLAACRARQGTLRMPAIEEPPISVRSGAGGLEGARESFDIEEQVKRLPSAVGSSPLLDATRQLSQTDAVGAALLSRLASTLDLHGSWQVIWFKYHTYGGVGRFLLGLKVRRDLGEMQNSIEWFGTASQDGNLIDFQVATSRTVREGGSR